MSLPPSGMASRALSEVENRGRKLIGVDGRYTYFVCKHRFDLDLLTQCGPQQPGGVDDQCIDVRLLRLKRLLSGERKKMLGEIRASRRRLVDRPCDGRELRLVLDGRGQNFDSFGDDRQGIVEIMGNGAGELAEGLPLFGLPDPVLRRDLVGEIAEE